MEIQKKSLEQMYPQVAHSRKLTECLIKLGDKENEERRTDGKMGLISIVHGLMPGGNPDFKNVVNFPMIRHLCEYSGKPAIVKIVLLLVRDFCASMNVAHNMTEDQQIEAAAMLVAECDNFRLEDYAMMFQIAKKGQLVDKLYHKIDLSTITEILNAYWFMRNQWANNQMRQEEEFYSNMGPAERISQPEHGNDKIKLNNRPDGYTIAEIYMRNQAKNNE